MYSNIIINVKASFYERVMTARVKIFGVALINCNFRSREIKL